MIELGLRTRLFENTRRARLKTRRKYSRGKFLLSKQESTSSFRESAVVHFVKSDLVCFSDEAGESDDDPTVVRTVEALTVAGSDVSVQLQEKEARSSGGIQIQ